MLNTIKALSWEVDSDLWSSYDVSMHRKGFAHGALPLVFPRYRSGDVRVSEQEVRFAVVSKLTGRGIPFSVETPTEDAHSFTGVGSRSGAFDVSVYDSAFRPAIHLEFKAGLANDKEIGKDFIKLVATKTNGYWYHVLESANSSTIVALFNKFRRLMRRVTQGTDVDSEKLIAFHVCVLRQRAAIHKVYRLSSSDIDSFFSFHYRATRSKLKMIDANGWDSRGFA